MTENVAMSGLRLIAALEGVGSDLVVSHTAYNLTRHGMVVVMPITTTVRPEIRTMIPIPAESKVKGSVIAEQIRTLDLSKRWWKTTGEVLSQAFVDRVVSTFFLIVGSAM